MKIQAISSPGNSLLKKIKSLHEHSGREKTGLFIIEGEKLVQEALTKQIEVQNIVVSKTFLEQGKKFDLPIVSMVDNRIFKQLSTTKSPSGVLAVAKIPQHSLQEVFSDHPSLIVVADNLQDPGNLGTLIRTAFASSATGIILTRGTTDPYNPKVVRATAGAIFSLPLVLGLTLEETVVLLKEHHIQLILCAPGARQPFWSCKLVGSLAVAFGNEGHGFPKSVLKNANQTICIPMNTSCESLNVAVAAGIVLFDCVRQRAALTTGGA